MDFQQLVKRNADMWKEKEHYLFKEIREKETWQKLVSSDHFFCQQQHQKKKKVPWVLIAQLFEN